MPVGLEQVLGYILTSKDVVSVILELLKEQDTWIREVADAERASAIQAIEAAKKGDYGQHMRVAIGHLRVVYNLLNGQARKPPTWWEKVNEFYGSSSRLYRVPDIAEEATKVAVLISQKHWDLGEKSNAKDWAKKAVKSFDLYEEYINLQPTYELHATPGGTYAEEIEGLQESKWAEIESKRKKLNEALAKQLSA